MHDALTRQPFGRRDIDAGIVGRIGGSRKRARMMPGAEQHGALARDRNASLGHGRLKVGRRDLGARRNVTQVDADTRHDAVLERILVDRYAALAEVTRGVDVVPP